MPYDFVFIHIVLIEVSERLIFFLSSKNPFQLKETKEKMSENLHQNFEISVKNLNDELTCIDQKYPNRDESDNCAKCMEKLNVYTRFTTDLINNSLCQSPDLSENENDSEESPSQNASDVATIQMQERAIDSLIQGKTKMGKKSTKMLLI